MTTAVIFVPHDDHIAIHVSQCLAYCAAKEYEVTGISTDWASVVATLTSRAAGVVVVARPDHLDPQREPRIEVIDQQASHAVPPRTAGTVAPRQRRPNQV